MGTVGRSKQRISTGRSSFRDRPIEKLKHGGSELIMLLWSEGRFGMVKKLKRPCFNRKTLIGVASLKKLNGNRLPTVKARVSI